MEHDTLRNLEYLILCTYLFFKKFNTMYNTSFQNIEYQYLHEYFYKPFNKKLLSVIILYSRKMFNTTGTELNTHIRKLEYEIAK